MGMSIGIGVHIGSGGVGASGGGGEVTDPNVNSIAINGWQANYTSPPAFDPVGDPKYVVALRDGFNASGAAITVTDDLIIMGRTRQVYPNQATLETSDVHLNDFVFAGEVITGVTNNSTRAYPKPICCWLDGGLRTVYDQSYTAKLAVAHQFARSGRPVAAVKFSATDGVTTVSSTVSTMTKTDYTASGLSAPHFEATLDLSTLADDALITIDATIYPWVGDTAFVASTDFAAYPSGNFCEMKVLNLSTEGPVYAYVDGVGAGTPAVHETAATAATTPYATILAAMQAVSAYNNTNFARNNATGGIIRVENGTYAHEDLSAVAVGDAGPVLEGVNATGFIYQGPAANNFDDLPDLIELKDLKIQMIASDVYWLDNSALLATNNRVTLTNVVWDANGFTGNGYILASAGYVTFIENSGDDLKQAQSFSSSAQESLAIGCSGPFLRSNTYNAVACYDLNVSGVNKKPSVTNRAAGEGQFFGWNFFGDAAQLILMLWDDQSDAMGFAAVGNVFEQRTGTLTSATSIGGTSGEMNNAVFMQNTEVGTRSIVAYSDAASTAKHVTHKFNVQELYNTKGDVFATDGTQINNWPTMFKVQHRGSTYLSGSSQDDVYQAGSWMGEVEPLDNENGDGTTTLVADWAVDASFTGTGAGGGDYTPGASSALSIIAAGLAPYPYDQNGTAVADDGTAWAGAIQ